MEVRTDRVDLDHTDRRRYVPTRPVRNAHDQLGRSTRAVALIAALAGVAFAMTATRGSAHATGDLAENLSAATGLRVSTGEVFFEDPRAVSLRDALVGRRVVFAARASEDGARDVYRATVRVTPGLEVLSLRDLANLTQTPLGDDGPIAFAAQRVAFATRAFGQIQSATVLDLSGAAGPQGVRRGVSNLLDAGSWHGVSRWDLRLDGPVRELEIALDASVMRARTRRGGWTVRLPDGVLEPAQGATFAPAPHAAKSPVVWAVDTVRSLPWVGTVPIEWLEQKVFTARDWVHRTAFHWFGVQPDAGDAPDGTDEPGTPGGTVLALPGRTAEDPHWPPARIVPPLGVRDRSEGVWVPATPEWVRAIPGAPPAFYRTFIRADADRPYARIVLLAMDMRQLDVGVEGGLEDPVPLVGPRGEGHIPRRPDVLARAVAAFNGGFKTEHGAYGIMVDRRVMVPPRAHAATLGTFADGHVALGTWGDSLTVPPSLVSFRQNLDPLLDNGVENPAHRRLWGFVLGGIDTMPTVRSGVCSDADGHLIYAWSAETTGAVLGHAMRLAGCSYGIHLDMNPTHAAFHFVRIDDIARRQTRFAELAHGMNSNSERFIYYTGKDFFYLTLRDTAPPAIPAGVAWSPSALPQPAPAWLPALFAADAGDGARHVRLTSVKLDRTTLRVRAGLAEPSVSGVPATSVLGADEARTVLGAVLLGTASPDSSRGLMVAGHVVHAFDSDASVLEIGPRGARIIAADALSPDATDALQGEVLLRGGDPVREARGGHGRLAIGLTADGRALLAEGDGDAWTLAATLRDAGARDAIVLDRGAGEVGVRWAGGAEPLRDSYASTVLFIGSRDAPPRVERLEPYLNPPP